MKSSIILLVSTILFVADAKKHKKTHKKKQDHPYDITDGY